MFKEIRNTYSMLYNSGFSHLGCIVSIFGLIILSPFMMIADLVYTDVDFGKFPSRPYEPVNFDGSPLPPLDCPPVGSKEWDDWVEAMPNKDLE